MIFKPITKDNEVTDINQVEIEKEVIVETSEKEIFTLPKIDAKIDKIQARIEHLQGDITELETLRLNILAEAEKVKLRIDVEPEILEEER